MDNNPRQPWALLTAVVAAIAYCGLAAATRAGVLADLDETIRSAVHADATPGLTALATAISGAGRLAVLLPASAAVVGGLVFARQRQHAVALGVTMGGALLLNWLLKAIVHRARPHPFFGLEPQTFSFPSGHVFFACCFSGALVLIFAIARRHFYLGGTTLCALVLAMAWSRVYLGVHYPSDVAAGILIGVFWLSALVGLGLFSPQTVEQTA